MRPPEPTAGEEPNRRGGCRRTHPVSQGRRNGRLRAAVLHPILWALICCLGACGGRDKITLTVKDRETAEGIPGVQIKQVGATTPLGTTDGNGQLTCRFRLEGEGTLKVQLFVISGEKDYEIERDYPISGTDFEYGEKTIRLEKKREAPPGATLEVTSSPEGASIYLDDEYRGAAPMTIENLSGGLHTIRLEQEGYRVQESRLSLEEGEQQTFDVQLVGEEITTASLEVITKPAGASISLNGKATGVTTPSTLQGLDPGRAKVGIRLEGYAPQTRETVLGAGEKSVVDFGPLASSAAPSPAPVENKAEAETEARKFSKTYSVTVAPIPAEVYLDGSNANLNPSEVGFSITLEEGVHHFRCVNKGARIERTLEYEVKPGDRTKKLVLDLAGGVARPSKFE